MLLVMESELVEDLEGQLKLRQQLRELLTEKKNKIFDGEVVKRWNGHLSGN